MKYKMSERFYNELRKEMSHLSVIDYVNKMMLHPCYINVTYSTQLKKDVVTTTQIKVITDVVTC